MATYTTPSSWGRTRRPKTLSTVEKSKAPAGTLETVRACTIINGAAGLAEALDSATEGVNGYATENQRFLHVTVSGQNAQTIKIYVYHYAIQLWSALMVNDGDGTFSQATATTAASGTAALQPQTFIFEIAGADRVAFVGDGTSDPTVHATCTTF